MSATVQAPFRKSVVAPRSWLSRLIGTVQPDRAQAAIANLFVDGDPGEVSASRVSEQLAAFGVLGRQARQILSDVYRDALRHFLADEELSDIELAYLARLRSALGLNDREAQVVLEGAAEEVFGRAVKVALLDGSLSPAERNRLEKLASALNLSEAAVKQVYGGEAGALLNKRLESILTDRRVSPDEMKALQKKADELQIRALAFEPKTQRLLDRYQRFWQMENGQMPHVATPINLQRAEVCHFQCAAQWHEMRTQTVRVGYAGVSSSIRIARGVSFRMGSYVPNRVTRDYLAHLDTGTVYITNKRLIFDGNKGNKAIRLTAMIGAEMFADAVKIEKATGKSPYLFVDDPEMLAVCLSSAMSLA